MLPKSLNEYIQDGLDILETDFKKKFPEFVISLDGFKTRSNDMITYPATTFYGSYISAIHPEAEADFVITTGNVRADYGNYYGKIEDYFVADERDEQKVLNRVQVVIDAMASSINDVIDEAFAGYYDDYDDYE